MKPHPTCACDPDPELEALRCELAAVRASLNAEHHPVRPGNPERLAALEARVAEVAAAIAARRAGLRAHA
jgi:hypothetical protein